MNKLYQVYTLLILLSLTALETSTAASNFAKKGCNDTCGAVRIPYPFGIGSDCSFNRWYTVDCNSSTPYLSVLNHLQVLGIDLEYQTVTVNTPMTSDCSQTTSVDLGRSPFLFSKSRNNFVFEGCGNAVMMGNGSSVTGCSTTCDNDSTTDKNTCLGITCCQTTIPYNLKSYSMNLTGLERLGGDRACRSALLVDKDSYHAGRFSFREEKSYVPISLMWTISDRDRENISCCSYLWSRIEVDMGDGTSMDSWKCIYNQNVKSKGSPYLKDACHYVSMDKDTCENCQNDGGFCIVDEPTYVVDGVAQTHFTCDFDALPYDHHKSNSTEGISISISMGVLFLVATIYLLYEVVKKRKEMRRRKRILKRNGALLLKQQEAEPSLVHKTILFTSRELEKATDNYNENRILGRGGHSTVYKGMLVDGRIVAIKKSKIIDENHIEHFINEVVILSQVNHRNVVKLLGCCLETEVPLLVSEFIPNGTLYDRLHKRTDELPISFNMRLRIATEVAGALSYLHSATSVPIYHRDIKTTNILLDEKYKAKVSDFGTSRFISIDQTHLTTLVKGTFGYLDPEYFRSSQFTEKSDVYSFGVVLIELLTGKLPISQTTFGEHRSLVSYFMLAMEEGHVLSIYDATVVNEGDSDDLFALANLAMRCLNLNGKCRPTMKEVAIELETIRTSDTSSTIYTNMEPVMYWDELSMPTYTESPSTCLSFNDSVSK